MLSAASLKILVSCSQARVTQHSLHSPQNSIHTNVAFSFHPGSNRTGWPRITEGIFTISLSSRNRDIPRNNVLPSVVDPLAQSDPKFNHHTKISIPYIFKVSDSCGRPPWGSREASARGT